MSGKMKKILLLLASVLVLTIALVSLGIGYAGGVRGIGLLGVCFFFTGGVVVILAQLIPAGILLSSFIGTAFTSFRKGEMPIRAT
ncbi:MAG: hypothetical protein H6Q41_1072 [Deltaproteobacteria bacterium]|jgi:hypothetical protein|nr:hypothetical protein [Deltaproteobacteria bacterium]